MTPFALNREAEDDLVHLWKWLARVNVAAADRLVIRAHEVFALI